MSRHRFEAYLDKVFDLFHLVDALPEGRQFPLHPWQKVFEAVFLGAAIRIPSRLQIQAECRRGVLAKRIGPISADTIGYVLQRQSPKPVFALGCDIARRLRRNGVRRSDWSRGLIGVVVDGIEICRSFARCCDACMQREVQHRVRGEMRTDIQYYHRIVAVVIVSTPFPIPSGIRFQNDGEAEVPCALALSQDLVSHLGRRFRIDHQRQVAVSQDGDHLRKDNTAVSRESTNARTSTRHQFRTRRHPRNVYPSTQPQPWAH